MRRRGRKDTTDAPTRFGANLSSTVLPGGSKRSRGDPFENTSGFVTPMERAAFREEKTAAWARSMPLKLQQFLQHSGNDVNMRIFRDVVVRFPVVRGTKEEILAFLEAYGEVEYVAGPNDGRARTGNERSAGDAASVAVATEYCHLVRFEEGADAIRCYFSLNGAMIDPEHHKRIVDDFKEVYATVTAEASQDGVPRDLPEDLHFPLLAPADNTRHIFITVDFFRLAFLLPSKEVNGKALPMIPARCALCTMLPSRRTAGSSISHLHAQMREEALKMAQVHPLVLSHNIEWEEFCFLVNFFSFIHHQSIPTCLGEEGDSPAAAGPNSEALVPAVSVSGAVRTVFRALKHANWDAVKVLNWVDNANDSGERALLEGRLIAVSKRTALFHSRTARQIALLLLLLGILSAVLFFWVE